MPTGDMPDALTPDDIDELARRAQDGDRDALETLLGAIRPRALNVCRGVLPYTPDAEDACQEALINIANKIGSWGGRGRFTTWMHVVAVNSARTTYRRMKNQAISSDTAAAGEARTRAPPASSPAPGSTCSRRWRPSSATTRSSSSRCCCATSTACPTRTSPSRSARRSARSRHRSITVGSWPARCCAATASLCP